MQKNRQRSPQPATQGRPQRRYPVAVPDVVNMDATAITPDAELIERLRSLEEGRGKVLDAHLDPRLWEEEVAYVRRELQVRRSRREAHDRYIKQLEQEYAESERNLPVADLDNTHFLRIVGEIN